MYTYITDCMTNLLALYHCVGGAAGGDQEAHRCRGLYGHVQPDEEPGQRHQGGHERGEPEVGCCCCCSGRRSVVSVVVVVEVVVIVIWQY